MRQPFLLTPPGLALLYLLLLMPFVVEHRLGRFDVETDFFAEYAPYAESMSRGVLPHDFPYRGPGYHAVLATARLICPDTFLAGKLISAISAAVFVGLVAVIAAATAGPAAGPVAALLAGLQPLVYLHGWTVGNDMFFAMLALAVIALFVRAARPVPAGGRAPREWPSFALAGVLAGYAFLTRPNGLFLLPAGLCSFLLFEHRSPSAGRRNPVVFVAGWGAPLLFWGAIYRLTHHAWPQSMNYRNLADSPLIGSGSVTADVYEQTVGKNIHGFSYLLTQLPALLAQAFHNLPAHLMLDARHLCGPLVSAAVSIGVLLLIWRDRPGRPAWILPMAGCWAFAVLLTVAYQPRLSLFQAAPAACLAMAAFVDTRAGEFRRWRAVGRPAVTRSTSTATPGGGPRLFPALLLLTSVTGAALTVRESLDWLSREQATTSIVETARFMRTQGFPPGAVAARKPHVAWYSGRPHAGIPAVDLRQLPVALRERGVVLLYYGAAEVEMLPQDAALLTLRGVPPGLQVVHVHEAMPVGVLFRLLPADEVAPFATPDLRVAMERLEQAVGQSGLARHIGQRQLSDQYQRGMLLMAQGKFEDAVEPLRAVATADPGSPEAHFNFGSAAIECGRWEVGRGALRRAEALGLRSSELYINLARALIELDSANAAGPYLHAFLTANPNHPLGLFHLAALRQRQGQTAAADSLLRLARSAGYPDNEAYRKLAETLGAAGGANR